MCPAGVYRPGEFRPVEESEIAIVETAPKDHAVTHRRGKKLWCLPRKDSNGWNLEIMGTEAARRFVAHYGVRPTWVGQCSYALYVKPR
ncbi:MAG: hypothetical protein KatS3mg087_1068 [Patescibacteria group bacterium]|nr:MAG: hypothetical protein KatS3mg087_1068 [Patescibacteria group bacterium]